MNLGQTTPGGPNEAFIAAVLANANQVTVRADEETARPRETGDPAPKMGNASLCRMRAGPLWWIPNPTLSELGASQLPMLSTLEVAYFVSALVLNGGLSSTSDNALLGAAPCTLVHMGARFSPFVVAYNQYWRLVTATAMQAGLITLIINLLLQFVLMYPLEREYGRALIFVLFWLFGFLTHLFACVASPAEVGTGASGALMGFIGLRVARDVLLWPDIPLDQRRKEGTVELFSMGAPSFHSQQARSPRRFIDAVVLFFTGLSSLIDNYVRRRAQLPPLAWLTPRRSPTSLVWCAAALWAALFLALSLTPAPWLGASRRPWAFAACALSSSLGYAPTSQMGS